MTLVKKYSDFNKKGSLTLEKEVKKSYLRYLLKHDNVKVLDGFTVKIYSLDDLDNTDTSKYLKWHSCKRKLRSIDSKISKLNKYYNSNAELFARAFEMYVLNREELNKKAPNVAKCYNECFMNNDLVLNFIKIVAS